MLNADLVIDSANEFARMLIQQTQDDAERVRRAYIRAFGRPSTKHETNTAMAFLREISNSAGNRQTKTSEQDAWALFCQSLFASNEFIYIR